MQKNHRRTFAQHVIDDFRVEALDFLESDGLHSCDLITEMRAVSRAHYAFVVRWAPTGAISSKGSSGMMIQAMG